MSRKSTLVAVLVGLLILSGVAAFALTRALDGRPRGPVEVADQTACRSFEIAVATTGIEDTIEDLQQDVARAVAATEATATYRRSVAVAAVKARLGEFTIITADSAVVPLMSDEIFEVLTAVVASATSVQNHLDLNADTTVYHVEKYATALTSSIADVRSACAA